jgi:hypothetical protein
VPGLQQIRPDVFAAAAQVTQGLARLTRRVDLGQHPARNNFVSLRASRRFVLIRTPGSSGVSDGAMTVQ